MRKSVGIGIIIGLLALVLVFCSALLCMGAHTEEAHAKSADDCLYIINNSDTDVGGLVYSTCNGAKPVLNRTYHAIESDMSTFINDCLIDDSYDICNIYIGTDLSPVWYDKTITIPNCDRTINIEMYLHNDMTASMLRQYYRLTDAQYATIKSSFAVESSGTVNLTGTVTTDGCGGVYLSGTQGTIAADISCHGVAVQASACELTLEDTTLRTYADDMPAVSAKDCGSDWLSIGVNTSICADSGELFSIEDSGVFAFDIAKVSFSSDVEADMPITIWDTLDNAFVVTDGTESFADLVEYVEVDFADNETENMYFSSWKYGSPASACYNRKLSADLTEDNMVCSVEVLPKYAYTVSDDIVCGEISLDISKHFVGYEQTVDINPIDGCYLSALYYMDNETKVYLYQNTSGVNVSEVQIATVAADKVLHAAFSPLSIEAHMDNVSHTYNGNFVALTAEHVSYPHVTYSYEWFVDGNRIEGATSKTYSIKDVTQSGSYTATISYVLGSSYSQPVYAEANIEPYAVTAVWDGDKSFAYDMAPKAPAPAFAAFGDDIVTYSGDGEATDVGNYTYSITSTNPNYTIVSDTCNYKITKAVVETVWGANKMVYNGKLQAPEASAIGFDGEALNVVVSGAQKNAGSYDASAYAAEDNYALSNDTVSFTISPKTVAVDWSYKYTNSNKYNGFYYSGYDQSDRVFASYATCENGVQNLDVTFYDDDDRATSLYLPQSYIAVAESDNNDNYVLINTTKELTMIKAKPVISVAENLSAVYDKQTHSIPATVDCATTLYYMIDGEEVSNSFYEIGIYKVTVFTKANSLYEAADSKRVNVTIATNTVMCLADGESLAEVTSGDVFTPNSTLICDTVINLETSAFKDSWARNVAAILNLSVVDGAGNTLTTSSDSYLVKVKLSDELINKYFLTVKCYRNGVETTVDYTIDEDGYLTFNTDSLGEFAIVATSELQALIGIAVLVVVVGVLILIIVSAVVTRRRRIY